MRGGLLRVAGIGNAFMNEYRGDPDKMVNV
jgi:hypothetical protein